MGHFMAALYTIFTLVGAIQGYDKLSLPCNEYFPCPNSAWYESFCAGNGQCFCSEGMIASDDQEHCLKAASAIGQECKEDGQCRSVIGGLCINEVCSCPNNLFDNTTMPGKCIRRALRQLCSPVKDWNCKFVYPEQCGYSRIRSLLAEQRHSVCRCPTPAKYRKKGELMQNCTAADKPLGESCTAKSDCNNAITRPHETCTNGKCSCFNYAHIGSDGTCHRSLPWGSNCYKADHLSRKAACFLREGPLGTNALTCLYEKCVCTNNRVYNKGALKCLDKGSPSPIVPSQGKLSSQFLGQEEYPVTITTYHGNDYCAVEGEESPPCFN